MKRIFIIIFIISLTSFNISLSQYPYTWTARFNGLNDLDYLLSSMVVDSGYTGRIFG